MSQLVPRIGAGALSSPMEVRAGRAPEAAEDLARLLKESGCDVVQLGSIGTAQAAAAAGRVGAEQHVDAMALSPASWFEDYLVLDLIEECDAPLLLWPLPGMETGALCGTQQLTCCLKQLEKPYASVFGDIERGGNLDAAMRFLRAAALRARLRRARIGLAGQRVRGMTEAAVNEIALKKSLGPRVVPVDMVGLLQRARNADAKEKNEVWSRIKEAAGQVRVSGDEGLSAAGAYLAIREVFRQEGLSALAFGCYPDFMGRACLAASLLADEGLPVGCEGDVNGAAGMLTLTLLTGQPTHNADWLDPLPDGTVVFTHCGSGSFHLAQRREDITLAPVRLAHQGVCALFPARPGLVTLVNLMPAGSGYQMAVMEGEALPAEMVFPGNPLRVRLPKPVSKIIEWIHQEGIGHHWMAGYGHVADELRHMARIVGTDLRLLEP